MSVISDKWSGEKEDEEVAEMSYLLFLEDILLEKKKPIRIFFNQINYRTTSVLIYFFVPKAKL